MASGRHPLDALTQVWLVATSRRLRRDETSWLLGPTAGPTVVGDTWVEAAAAASGGATSTGPTHGLLPDFNVLAGSSFDPVSVDQRIVDFYQHTAAWRLTVRADWARTAQPVGRLITRLWSQRLQQLSLPLAVSGTPLTIDSKAVHLHDATGAVTATAWTRTIRQTGATAYSGQYDTVTLPGSTQPSVRVAFPLPSGWLTVLLRPSVDPDGSFHLRSPMGAFGTDGAYLALQRADGTVNVRRIPIAEHFHLRAGHDQTIHADHWLRLRSINAVHLDYRVQHRTSDEPRT